MKDRTAPPVEIERKFLVPEPPTDLKRHPRSRIRQGYLVISEDGSEARVRKEGDQHFLTFKSGSGGSRAELEIPIDPEDFARLWPLTRGGVPFEQPDNGARS